ncbi:MAG: hypothetical protein M3N31_02745 [Actinomycetota bacterium]|nr:hypothetical protein [Actinomycetota bacterium]
MGLRETLEAGSRRVLVILAVSVVLLGGLAYTASPFNGAGGLKCNGALLGAKPRERATTGLLVGREKSLCRSKANSRLIVGGLATLAALVVVLGAVLLPVGPLEDLLVRQE